MDNNENTDKEIEVVNGDGSELEFSPVYEHLNAVKPKPKQENKKKLIIPEVKSKKETDKKEDDPKGNNVTITMEEENK